MPANLHSAIARGLNAVTERNFAKNTLRFVLTSAADAYGKQVLNSTRPVKLCGYHKRIVSKTNMLRNQF